MNNTSYGISTALIMFLQVVAMMALLYAIQRYVSLNQMGVLFAGLLKAQQKSFEHIYVYFVSFLKKSYHYN